MERLYRSDEEGALVVGMFLYEGFREHLVSETDEAGGAIEQAEWLAGAATAVVEVLEEEFALGGGECLGVVEYEVVNPVGWWIAEMISDEREWPELDRILEVTRSRARTFFS